MMNWSGVFPAITTPFTDTLNVDHEFLVRHIRLMLGAGCRGFVALGSLGEAATLSLDEKIEVLHTCRAVLAGRAPLVVGIAALSTKEAVDLALEAQRVGCDGLMVLPPYVYRGDKRETLAHFAAVLSATPLPCMLYNNPIAYGTDVLPETIARLAVQYDNLVAVKESSTDVRRITELKSIVGTRLALFVGVDDLLVEGVRAGACGWIAGLVNAFPAESVRLFDLTTAGHAAEAEELYDWFLPLLRLDTVPKFVQLIKLVQQEVGLGSERVRPPRLPLSGDERKVALGVIRSALEARP